MREVTADEKEEGRDVVMSVCLLLVVLSSEEC
jgi:hypothetical protein